MAGLAPLAGALLSGPQPGDIAVRPLAGQAARLWRPRQQAL